MYAFILSYINNFLHPLIDVRNINYKLKIKSILTTANCTNCKNKRAIIGEKSNPPKAGITFRKGAKTISEMKAKALNG